MPFNRRPARLLHLFACVIALTLIAAACASSDDQPAAAGSTTTTDVADSSTTTSSTPQASSSSTTAVAGGPEQNGLLNAIAPGGRYAIVADEPPGERILGCEESEAFVLYRVDLETGEREPLTDDGALIQDRSVIDDPRSGRVALADGCEGFLTSVLVGTIDASGRLDDLAEVRGLDSETAGEQAGVDFSAAADGLLVAGIFGFDPPRLRVQLFDPETGAAETITEFEGFAFGVTDLDDGTLLYVTDDQGVEARSRATGELLERWVGYGNIVRGPGGARAALLGGDVAVWNGVDDLEVWFDPGAAAQVFSAAWTPDGQNLVVAVSEGEEFTGELLLVGPDGVEARLLGAGDYGRPLVDPQGRFVLVNEFGPEIGDFPILKVALP